MCFYKKKSKNKNKTKQNKNKIKQNKSEKIKKQTNKNKNKNKKQNKKQKQNVLRFKRITWDSFTCSCRIFVDNKVVSRLKVITVNVRNRDFTCNSMFTFSMNYNRIRSYHYEFKHPFYVLVLYIVFKCANIEPIHDVHRVWRWSNIKLKVSLTGGNWQKWKRVFLTCPCHEIYRDEAVGLKSCKNTWKITIFVKMWKLGQYRENLIFCQ